MNNNNSKIRYYNVNNMDDSISTAVIYNRYASIRNIVYTGSSILLIAALNFKTHSRDIN